MQRSWPINTTGQRRSRRAFSLLEVLVSVLIVSMILGGIYGFYSLTVRLREEGQQQVRQSQLASVILSRMRRELESTTKLGEQFGAAITGMPSRIEFKTLVVPPVDLMIPQGPRDPQRVAESDVRRIKYGLVYVDPTADPPPLDDAEMDKAEYAGFDITEAVPFGLRRTEIKSISGRGLDVDEEERQQLEDAATDTLDAEVDLQSEQEEDKEFELDEFELDDVNIGSDSILDDIDDPRFEPVVVDVLSNDIRYFSIQYYDGLDWRRVWQGERSNVLPQSIRITIGFSYGPMIDEESIELSEDDFITVPDEVLEDEEKTHNDRYSITVRMPAVDDFEGLRVRRQEVE